MANLIDITDQKFGRLTALKWDYRFLSLAELISSWSKDSSTKVGAVITTKNNVVVSLGYNGFPQKMEDKEEWYSNREEKYDRIIHAEQNALLFSNKNVEGCILYTYPMIPCHNCFKIMVQAGITRFIAPKPTEDQLSRWGESFAKTKKYALECNVEIVEIDYGEK